MVLPIGTDQHIRRTPWATIALIAANTCAYLAMMALRREGGDPALLRLLDACALSREHFAPWQPITYQFLHDPTSILHLLGNMVFLWTFGTATEGRLGRLGFLAFYLAGGAVAGLVQIWLSKGAVIGASGSVSAVSGAFIVLFPRARVAVLLLFSVVPMPALLLVALYFVLDSLGVLSARDGIGHIAHLSGTIFGMGTTLALIGTGIVRRTDMDMLFLIKQWRRRAEMRAVVRGSEGKVPWVSPGKDVHKQVAASPVAQPVKPSPPAADAFTAVRTAERMIAEANAAFHAGDFAGALRKYEDALARAPQARDADQARLMVAVICIRKRPDVPRARTALAAIGSGLPAEMRPLFDALRAQVAR